MENGKPIEVTDANFKEEVLESKIPVLVDFWAPWCRPCAMAAPVLEKIAQEYQGRLKVCKLNVDEGQKMATEYGIEGIPTLNMYKDSKVVNKVVGVIPESYLKKMIEKYLK